MPDLPIRVLNYSSLIARLHAELHRDKPDVDFIVDGKLMGKQRHRNFGFMNKNKKIQTSQYTPKETINYEQKVALSFKEKCNPLKENTALFIEIVIHHQHLKEIEKRKNYEEVRHTARSILREYNFSSQEYHMAEQYLHSCISSGDVALNTVDDYRKCLNEFERKLEIMHTKHYQGVSIEQTRSI